jgi:hypothetical protein
MHENRETSGATRSKQDRDRLAKAQSHEANMHAPEESDRAVLPMNQPNKGEQSSVQADMTDRCNLRAARDPP